jgi:hypothetical protein
LFIAMVIFGVPLSFRSDRGCLGDIGDYFGSGCGFERVARVDTGSLSVSEG